MGRAAMGAERSRRSTLAAPIVWCHVYTPRSDFYPSRCDSLDDIDLKCLDSSSVGVSCNKTSKSNILPFMRSTNIPSPADTHSPLFTPGPAGAPPASRKRGGCGEVLLSPGLIHFRGSESMRSAAPTATPMAVAASRGRLGHAVVGV